MTRTGHLWTTDELRMLAFDWGAVPVDQLAERLGRTVQAVATKAKELGYGAAGRGRVGVEQLARRTGYTWHQIMRGIRMAGVRPLVLNADSRRQRRMLTEEQAEAVVAALGAETRAATEAVTVTGLADELGVAARTVQRHCRRLGVIKRRGVLKRKRDAARIRDSVKGRLR